MPFRKVRGFETLLQRGDHEAKEHLTFSTLILAGAAIAYTLDRMQQGRVKVDDDWNEEGETKSKDISDENSYLSDNDR